MADDLDNELDENLDGDTGSGSDNSAPPAAGAPANDASSKRVNDLMSKWQAAEARAKKAEAEAAQLKGAAAPPADPKPADGPSAAQVAEENEFIAFAREIARKQLFDSEPTLAEYGLEPKAITGSTVAEMQASFEAQRQLVKGIESRARNKALVEHGLSPEAATGQGEPPPSFSTMSDKEFDAYLAERDARPR